MWFSAFFIYVFFWCFTLLLVVIFSFAVLSSCSISKCFVIHVSLLGMETAVERASCAYQNSSQRYVVSSREYTKQYAHICSQRLTVLREILKKKAQEKYGSDVPVFQLFELTVDVKCVLIGSLYKDMDLKPNILKELGDEYGFVAQPVRDRYVSPTDRLMLEDELQQVQLTGDIDQNALVTGAVIGVYGYETELNRGHFVVDEIIYPDVDIPPAVPSTLSEDKYVMFLSGLEFAASTCDHIPNFNLLCDWLTGNALTSSKLPSANQVTRLVIAGNSLSQSVHERDYLSKAKYLTKKAAVPTVEPMNALDLQLAVLTPSINVDVMPGETDPANMFWPQQPLIRSMLPTACRGGGVSMVTNPYAFTADGVRFIVTSGQNIADIMRYANVDSPLEAMEMTLKFRLIAPTAPDTLPCYPLIDNDPFIIDEAPNVYLCANLSDKVQTKWYYPSQTDNKRGILMVCLPSFAKSKSVVLLNLKNLIIKEISMN